MANFSKLNIGDAVASSGGRVWKKLSAESATEDSIVGTWVLNDNLVGFPENDYVFGQTTENIVIGTTYHYEKVKDLRGVEASNRPSLRYYYTDNTTNWCYYKENQWQDVAAKTIIFNENADTAENKDAFLAWLKANATKQ